MTTFTGPVNIRQLDSDTTAAHIAAAGSAQFTGNVFSGAGAAYLTQGVSATNAGGPTSAVHVPAAHLHDVLYKGLTTFSSAGGVVDIMIGTSGDDNAIGTFSNVSGRGALSLTEDGTNVCANAMHGLAAQTIFMKTTAVSGAVASAGVAHLTFVYSRR